MERGMSRAKVGTPAEEKDRVKYVASGAKDYGLTDEWLQRLILSPGDHARRNHDVWV
jgi:hypothetical protein